MNHSTSKGTGKSDLRIVKTKRAIMNELTDLLKAKSIGKITVTELAQRAEINKGTFTCIIKTYMTCTRKLCSITWKV